MRIVIAPDSFKESLSSLEVAKQIELGFKQIFPSAIYIKCPVADGGEGTVKTMVDATKGTIINVKVTGPLGNQIESFFGLSKDKKCAFIEMAAASGLELIQPSERNPLLTTSYGTGELIKHALSCGITHCIIGIGGSATNDGGAGMLQALGAKLLNKNGQQISYGGSQLKEIQQIDLSEMDPRIFHCHFDIACDVTNPLTGKNGASAIFGPQKGATPELIEQLDKNLKHFAKIIKSKLNIDVENVPGSGAAGGMGASLLAFLRAELKPGFNIITSLLKLDSIIQDADLVITGEGRLDSQSINGKVPIGIAKLAKRYNIPVIAITGSLGDDVDIVFNYGIDAVYSVLHKIEPLNEALKNAKRNLFLSSRNIAATLKIGNKIM